MCRAFVIAIFTGLCVLGCTPTGRAAEQIPEPHAAPVGVDNARALAVHQYFYVDFPRRLQMLENEIELAEAEFALIVRRVDSYRPFRSFGRYAATYTVDQAWQVALLAARQRLECLATDQADLWRERRLVAQSLNLTSAGE